ncbi:MAG: phosphoglucosamine mutase [Thermodesulfovibrionales bacterium]|nr:phosphoglucosamine mutase [Thermodesulfovibrionales bacterium]
MTLFGTDGVRGLANTFPIIPEVVVKIGMAIAEILNKDSKSRRKVLIGKDTRLSGYLVESALTAGLCSMGIDVMLVGPMPSPAIAFLTRSLRLDAGVVISASHNPYYDNGIKIFSASGLKLPDHLEREIEKLVLDKSFPKSRPADNRIGKVYRLEDSIGRYIEFIKSTVPRELNLEGMKIVVDSANGAAYKITPHLLRELGAEVISINDTPDGLNINDNCGSTHMSCIKESVLKYKADIGIAHDGDADRTLFVDELGNIVDGDMILAICAIELKADNKLKNDTVVATVMTNSGIEEYLKTKNIRLVRVQVGDRYVVEEMIKNNYNLGGEQSGHIIFFDYNTTGDGPLTAIQVLNLLKKREKRLSELTDKIELYPQILINVPISRKENIEKIPEIIEAIRGGYKILNNHGRILVRPSGTEPKVRIMVEAKEHESAKSIAENIARLVHESLGRETA